MRIYEYSWEAKDDNKAAVEIYVDEKILNYLITAVEVDIKNAVEIYDFKKAKDFFKELDILMKKMEKLSELEEELQK